MGNTVKTRLSPRGFICQKTSYGWGLIRRGGYSKGDLLNVMVLESAKHNTLHYFCSFKVLSHEDMTHIKHILNVDKGKGASKPNTDQ